MKASELIVIIVVAITASCSPSFAKSNGSQGGVGTRSPPDIVSGDDTLRLYGITPDQSPEPTPTVLDQPWFPRTAWVSASILPYEDRAPIRILPVYSDGGLDVTGTWLGDLSEAEEVVLLGVDPAGRACYVTGEAVQGWSLEGWVACNRLMFEEPTNVPEG